MFYHLKLECLVLSKFLYHALMNIDALINIDGEKLFMDTKSEGLIYQWKNVLHWI